MVAGSSEMDMCNICNEPMANSQDYPVAGHICGEQARERKREKVFDIEDLKKKWEDVKGQRYDVMPRHTMNVEAPIYPQGMNKEQWWNHVALEVMKVFTNMGMSAKGSAITSYEYADEFIAAGEKRKDVVE